MLWCFSDPVFIFQLDQGMVFWILFFLSSFWGVCLAQPCSVFPFLLCSPHPPVTSGTDKKTAEKKPKPEEKGRTSALPSLGAAQIENFPVAGRAAVQTELTHLSAQQWGNNPSCGMSGDTACGNWNILQVFLAMFAIPASFCWYKRMQWSCI